jgi:hypothetical protein
MKIKKEKIKIVLKRIFQRFGKNLFSLLILLLVLDLLLGGIFFWKYCLKKGEERFQLPPPLKINQALLKKFSSDFAKREAVFKSIPQKQYPDPFRGLLTE